MFLKLYVVWDQSSSISPFIHILCKFLNIFQYTLLSNFHCHVALCCYNDLAFILNQTKLLYK